MDIKLMVLEERTKTRTVQLRAQETVVGRHTDCGLKITSPEVSRRHCRLVVHNGYLMVEDLHSSNGTFLNGKAVQGVQVVRPGDRLAIGPVTFFVEYTLTEAARKQLLRDQDEEGELLEEVDNLEEVTEVQSEVGSPDEDSGVIPLVEELESKAPPAPRETKKLLPRQLPDAGITNDNAEAAAQFDTVAWRVPEDSDIRDVLSTLDETTIPISPPPPHTRKRDA